MDNTTKSSIKNIKIRIAEMLQERAWLEESKHDKSDPSSYWSDFCAYFDYMIGMQEESFSKLRIHTYHLTGDNYQKYYFEKDISYLVDEWETITKHTPSDFIIHEPEGGIGHRLKNGKLISFDVLRFQHTINTFHSTGILKKLFDMTQQQRFILEIGAGYAGFGYHLHNILKKGTYVIVDLPETLLFSAAYLTLLNPEKKLYLYNKNDCDSIIKPDAANIYDFILIPNYKLELIESFKFDLAVNIASFQEMRTDQVEKYLDFIAHTCQGTLYSWNQDVKPKNKELTNLTSLLQERFNLTEISPIHPKKSARIRTKQSLKKIAASVGLLDKQKAYIPEWNYKEYLCQPLSR